MAIGATFPPTGRQGPIDDLARLAASALAPSEAAGAPRVRRFPIAGSRRQHRARESIASLSIAATGDAGIIGSFLGEPSWRQVTRSYALIRDLAELVVSLTGTRSPVEYRELPSDDPVRRKYDIRRARETLYCSPSVPLRDGLLKTVEYFRAVL